MTAPQSPAEPHIQVALTWLAWAEGDLVTAKHNLLDPDIPPRQAAQHAEQAAEKAVKAGLVLRQIDFGKQHDVEMLAGWLGWRLGTSAGQLERLSACNTEARDPDSGGDAPNDAEAKAAVAVAERVVSAVRARFNALGVTTDQVKPA